MGKDKTTTVVNSNTQPTATPEETRLNQMDIAMRERIDPLMAQTQEAGMGLINKLLLGETNLPGFFGQIGTGISEPMISDISQNALRDLYPQFQSQGILDSGTAASVAGRTAGDVRRSVSEYNLNNKINLLNLALSGQAQVQQPVLGQAANLGSRLAGLRSTSTQGTQTSYGQNPFLKSFQTSLGSSLGKGQFGDWAFKT